MRHALVRYCQLSPASSSSSSSSPVGAESARATEPTSELTAEPSLRLQGARARQLVDRPRASKLDPAGRRGKVIDLWRHRSSAAAQLLRSGRRAGVVLDR